MAVDDVNECNKKTKERKKENRTELDQMSQSITCRQSMGEEQKQNTFTFQFYGGGGIFTNFTLTNGIEKKNRYKNKEI